MPSFKYEKKPARENNTFHFLKLPLGALTMESYINYSILFSNTPYAIAAIVNSIHFVTEKLTFKIVELVFERRGTEN